MEIGVTGHAIIAFGAILAAVIAGSFSFLNLITSKEQKVSEFRQNWIDALRNSISEYISSLSYISILYKHYYEKEEENKDKFEMTKGIEEIYAKVNKSYNDIIFRVNDKEEDEEGKILNDAFLKALETTRVYYNKANYIESFKSCDAVREATKPLLKYEWKRVKKGEPAYKKAKKVSAFVLVCGLVVAILDFGYVIYQSQNSQPVPTKQEAPVKKDQITPNVPPTVNEEKETPNKQLKQDAQKIGAPVI